MHALLETKGSRLEEFIPLCDRTWVSHVTHPLIVLGVVSANATFPNDISNTHIQNYRMNDMIPEIQKYLYIGYTICGKSILNTCEVNFTIVQWY